MESVLALISIRTSRYTELPGIGLLYIHSNYVMLAWIIKVATMKCQKIVMIRIWSDRNDKHGIYKIMEGKPVAELGLEKSSSNVSTPHVYE